MNRKKEKLLELIRIKKRILLATCIIGILLISGCTSEHHTDKTTSDNIGNKEAGYYPCNYECCDPQYHPNYQEKPCLNSVCCPNSNICVANLNECG